MFRMTRRRGLAACCVCVLAVVLIGCAPPPSGPPPTTTQPVARAAGITVGNAHSCALLTDRTARCWGDNLFGQLGDGTTSEMGQASVQGLTGAADLDAGSFHNCAVLVGGSVKCWGLNGSGQLSLDEGHDTGRVTGLCIEWAERATGEGPWVERRGCQEMYWSLCSGPPEEPECAELNRQTKEQFGWPFEDE